MAIDRFASMIYPLPPALTSCDPEWQFSLLLTSMGQEWQLADLPPSIDI